MRIIDQLTDEERELYNAYHREPDKSLATDEMRDVNALYNHIYQGGTRENYEPQGSNSRTIQERLDQYTDKTGACWVWTGNYGSSDGRPRITINGVNHVAYRVVYAESIGVDVTELPDGHEVDHISCGNGGGGCVTPECLQLLTKKEHDAKSALERRIFTDEAVREIQGLYATGNYTQQQLAEIYGGSRATICRNLKRNVENS